MEHIKSVHLMTLQLPKTRYDSTATSSGRYFNRKYKTATRQSNCCFLIELTIVRWVCGRSLAGIEGSNPAGGHACLSVVSVVCCPVDVSASG
jgi:hypothetical protein